MVDIGLSMKYVFWFMVDIFLYKDWEGEQAESIQVPGPSHDDGIKFLRRAGFPIIGWLVTEMDA